MCIRDSVQPDAAASTIAQFLGGPFGTIITPPIDAYGSPMPLTPPAPTTTTAPVATTHPAGSTATGSAQAGPTASTAPSFDPTPC